MRLGLDQPEMEVYHDLWHESLELALVSLGCSYERFWEEYRTPTIRSFFFTHDQYTYAVAAAAGFCYRVWPFVAAQVEKRNRGAGDAEEA
jgi:hypothetical protein